jgi:hypothetical protein
MIYKLSSSYRTWSEFLDLYPFTPASSILPLLRKYLFTFTTGKKYLRRLLNLKNTGYITCDKTAAMFDAQYTPNNVNSNSCMYRPLLRRTWRWAWTWLCFGLCRRAVWQMFTDVSEVLAVGKLLPKYMALQHRRQAFSAFLLISTVQHFRITWQIMRIRFLQQCLY